MGRLGHTLSTLRPVGRPTGRKTRFRLLARLYRVGSLSHWVPPKRFLRCFLHRFPPFPGFPWRKRASVENTELSLYRSVRRAGHIVRSSEGAGSRGRGCSYLGILSTMS